MNPNPLHQFGDVVSGRYLITTPLRQDEFGITYGAQDFIEDRRVMVRVFSLSQQKDWKILDWFQQEVRLLTQLDHPGIPKYYNHFVEDTPVDQRFYLVQEFIEGEFLSDLLAWGWRASEADLRHIASQILEILIYLHRPLFPIIHQNIHPSNIICQSDGKVFLVNFGTAHYSYSLEPRNHIDHPVVGMLNYSPLEQLQGQPVPSSDLYSLGATVVSILIGESSLIHHPQTSLERNARKLPISKSLVQWLHSLLEPGGKNRCLSAKIALKTLQSDSCPRLLNSEPLQQISRLHQGILLLPPGVFQCGILLMAWSLLLITVLALPFYLLSGGVTLLICCSLPKQSPLISRMIGNELESAVRR